MEKTELMKRYEAETDECATYPWHNKEFVTDDVLDWAWEKIQKLQAENAQLKDQLRWRPVSEKPEKGKEVILSYVDCYGHRINVLGSYVRRFDEETDSADDEDVMEYSDEKDEYYLKEGWYEHTTHSDYDHWLLHEKIDKWLPIPRA